MSRVYFVRGHGVFHRHFALGPLTFITVPRWQCCWLARFLLRHRPLLARLLAWFLLIFGPCLVGWFWVSHF